MKIENIYIKRDSEGNITGDIEISKNGVFDCVCFLHPDGGYCYIFLPATTSTMSSGRR